MAITYPTALDAFTNPIATDLLDSLTVPHDVQHANANDAIEALEAKVGVTSSAVTSSMDYRMNAAETSLTGKLAATLADAKGDLLVATAADTVARFAVGTNGQAVVADSAQTAGIKWQRRLRPVYPLSADGLVAASADLATFRDNSTLGASSWYVRMLIEAGDTISTCYTAIHSAGTLGAGGENSFAIYTDAGVLVAQTVTDDALWSSTGVRIKALAAPIAAQTSDRYILVGIRVTGYAVGPSFAFLTGSANTLIYDGLFPSAKRRSFTGTGSTWPASFDPATHGGASGGYMPFVALS